ncbi:uncharacterized protein LOC126234921 [Schistocerca nitens]|uniref:uncharacterized protein LOC126234921 n=1 Tax=Schistocerca nitens TaxID=7011 RepID=UPI002117A052|nr:uncharacterized protein LOC126234921 [Schistocerca nitens]
MPTLQDIVNAVTSGRDGSAPLEYKKGARSTGEGDRYEERMLALVFLRCLRRGLLFQLSANNGDAGKFDDLVLVWRPEGYNEAHTLFVQLKHRIGRRSVTLRVGEWLSVAPNSDFGLGKYCTSYGKIRDSLKTDRLTFVLLTNAHLGINSVNMFERQTSSVRGLELIQTGGELYMLNPNNEHVPEAVRKNTGFVNHFYLMCKQRNYDEIMGEVFRELEELLGAGDTCESIYDGLCKSLREWMNAPKGVCLTSGWRKWQAIVDEYIRKEVTACRALTTKLKYCSVADVRDYMESRNPAWVRPPEKGKAALSATKIHQALRQEPHMMVTVEQFIELRHQILRCWGPFCRWLVIVDDDRDDNILSELVTGEKTERRLVIVSSRESNGFVDTCKSSDTCDDSWNEFLDVNVRLNGDRYEFRLGDLVAGVDALKSLVDGELALLLALARLTQPLRMGRELETPPSYYVPRKLVDRRLVTDEFFSTLGHWDVCVIDSASYELLSRKISRHSVTSFADIKCWFPNPPEIDWPLFVLTDKLETIREECRSWDCLNVYMLQGSHDAWEIVSFSGQPERIRDYTIKREKEQLEALDTASNIVIVEGRPGVGKSTMLSHAAQEIKKRDSACWLLRVNLLDFYAVLDRSGGGASAAEDILKRTVVNEKELGRLEYALLCHCLLQSPRVVCLVDGFDEVCPDYENKCLEVLPLLEPRQGKLLVTTRPAALKPLETRMGVLAHSLEPFSKSELEDFFAQHPSRGNIPPSSGLSKSLRNLLRIPLFAEMFANLSQEILETNDIVTLYEAFFQNKFRRLYEEKWGDNFSAPGKKREVEEAQKRHEEQLGLLAASVLLYSTDTLPVPQFDSGYFVKAGIVYKFVDGKPTFLHRTFAEYFLAKWCFIGYREQSRLVVYRELYRRQTLEFFLEAFNRMAARNQPLLEAVLDGDEDKVEALLIRGADLKQADACGRNVLHVAVSSSAQRSLNLLPLLCRHARADTLSAEDGLLRWTPLRYAAEAWCFSAMDVLAEAGAALSNPGVFPEAPHDPRKLQALLRRRGYSDLFYHVYQVNNPSWKGGNFYGEVEFTASLISANLPRELLRVMCRKAAEEGHGMVCYLLSKLVSRTVDEKQSRQKTLVKPLAIRGFADRLRKLLKGGQPKKASAEAAVQGGSSSRSSSCATEVPDGGDPTQPEAEVMPPQPVSSAGSSGSGRGEDSSTGHVREVPDGDAPLQPEAEAGSSADSSGSRQTGPWQT